MSVVPSGPIEQLTGWRYPRLNPSLPESHATVRIPRGVSFWRKALAFAGPGYMVAVGYMDPGNWATDLAGGARFGYTLLSVVLLSNLMAILLQSLALKLGIVTGRDLAQACRDHYSRPVSFVLWVLCEIAIAACDLAEVIGSAIALNLLFGIPLVWGVCLTALDVLLILLLQHKGFRYLEAFIITLIATIGALLRGRAGDGPARHGRRARRPGPDGADRHQPGDALHRDRHSRRHRDAAQSLPALLHRADPERAARRRLQARGDPLRHPRFHGGAAVRLLHQRGHPDSGGGHLPRHGSPGRGRHRRRLPAADPAAGHHVRRAPCSRSRCWPRGRTRPSPAPWRARS